MGVLVTRTFDAEQVNGVAFTGNPPNSSDRRFTVVAQFGEISVVSPPRGVVGEKSLLEVVDGELVGMSMFNGYSYNERCMLSLAIVNSDVKVGDVLTLKWGEPDETGKTSIESPHKQAEIRVMVAPTPYAAEARENYADSWRTKAGS